MKILYNCYVPYFMFIGVMKHGCFGAYTKIATIRDRWGSQDDGSNVINDHQEDPKGLPAYS